jgi:hypothetical protein
MSAANSGAGILPARLGFQPVFDSLRRGTLISQGFLPAHF